MADESYGKELPEEVNKLAKEDLREDDLLKKQSLDRMREWLAKSSEIKFCRDDAPFLLRFLRSRKYSIPQAQEMLERYLAIRQLYGEWFRQLDPTDPKMSALIDSGYCFPLIEKDEFGRRVIFTAIGNFKATEFTAADMVRYHAMVIESLLDEEESQVTGYTQIYDENGLSMAHLAMWSLTDIRNIIRCIQNSLPMRHKSSHFLSLPSSANTIFEFFTSLLNEKLKKRIVIHKSIEDLHQHIKKDILPKEYGGTVSISDMTNKFKQDLMEKRQKLLDLDKLEIDLSKKEKLVQDFHDDMAGIAGSFRQLQVD
ncbi:retinaldehyde-binding protein 1 [Halyomorpha halys]|uniref:retinaldehyde-binding protein 1 n=1 Tax=Halyomorpha halys TaxID=286706 RepID=UPI0006D4F852|nr:clavesin-1 [Halyomorpha halys]